MFNIFNADHSYEIDECLLVASLGHLSSLNTKLKSNWNYMKMKTWCQFFSI